jgi:Zn-dependent M28 family amino/carboxypeptidase
MRETVERLCSDEMAGRRPGTAGGAAAARFVESRFTAIGLDPAGEQGYRQPIGPIGGVNLLGAVPGDRPGWVLLAAHFDHLGSIGRAVFRGANDNAAGVAVLLEVAAALAGKRRSGRSVLICSFDAEEPPYFLGPTMGSQWFVDRPTIPLGEIDLMICLDLVGTAFGPSGLPAAVRESIFVQGAETSSGTAGLLDGLPEVPGIRPRHLPDWIIEPMSDQFAFRESAIPWVFYTVGRDARYHQPADTPEHLDYPKMAALAIHLEHLVEAAATSPGRREYLDDPAGDEAAIASLRAVLEPLTALDRTAGAALAMLDRIAASLDDGRLPEDARSAMRAIVFRLEETLAGS